MSVFHIIAPISLTIIILNSSLFSYEYLGARDALLRWAQLIRLRYVLRPWVGKRQTPKTIVEIFSQDPKLRERIEKKDPQIVDLLNELIQDENLCERQLEDLFPFLQIDPPPDFSTYLIAKYVQGIFRCALCLGFWVGLIWWAAFLPGGLLTGVSIALSCGLLAYLINRFAFS